MSDIQDRASTIETEGSPVQERQTAKILRHKRIGIAIAGVIAALILLPVFFYGYLYATTPSHLRNPQFEHYHIRAQVIIDGAPVDFSREEFQEAYSAGTCSAKLNSTPIDFHDNQDQMAHVHWRGVTGGEFLKFYGWNFIGGDDNSLGWRFDQGMMSVYSIETSGKLLPDAPGGAQYYIYTGDKDTYMQKDWNNFLDQDIEDFMGKKSYLNTSEETSFNILDAFTSRAYAHGALNDGHREDDNDEQKLEKLNNLIGNLVIFAQKEEPTDSQIRARLSNLIPLSDSVCGG